MTRLPFKCAGQTDMAESSAPNLMQARVDVVVKILDLLQSGQATCEELRARVQELPEGQRAGPLALIELAEMVHQGPNVDDEKPLPTVKNPRYRKATGMRAVRWADCLWQPGGLSS